MLRALQRSVIRGRSHIKRNQQRGRPGGLQIIKVDYDLQGDWLLIT